jgi:MYXO-CTERM domain-containing protein
MKTRAALLVLLLGATANAVQVRSDRPRLLLSDGTGKGVSAAEFKRRCTSDAAYQGRCQGAISTGGGLFPAIALAAGYVANGDAAKCTAAAKAALAAAGDVPGQPDAHSFISNNGRTMLSLSVVRDWCDPVLSGPEKSGLEAKITAYADFYLTAAGLDVFHDDMTNVWNSVALAGLSLKGTNEDTKAQAYLTAADLQWKTVILPAMAYERDWWHEGFTYVQPTLGSLAWYALAWTTATDDDVFAWAKTNANDLMEGYLAFHAYALRPNGTYVYFGDTSSNKQSVELFSRYLVDILTTGTGSALGQGLSLGIQQLSRPGYDYAGDNGWMPALLYDASKDGAAAKLSSLPTARWLSQGAQDVAVMRSGWGPDDTYVWMTCGDYFGAHQHVEAGAFQIFRKSQLSGSDGCYDAFDSDHWANYYSQHSVHANTLAVYEPVESFPTSLSIGNASKNVNDGGQRVLRRNLQGTAFGNPDLATYLQHKAAEPLNETGDMKAFVHGSCYDYVGCDVTAAYDSPKFVTNGNAAKVNEVTRQLVFLPPSIVVVFDRVEATDASYDKRFLLHGLSPPVIAGASFSITNGPGKLMGQTLLPAAADVSVVSNYGVAGAPHPPSSTSLCDEAGGTRLEISPKQERARDYFLHVLYATDSTVTVGPTASATEDANGVTATIDDGSNQYVLTLPKIGPIGGHLAIRAKSGATVCDQDLATGAAAGPDGGLGVGGTGAGGSSGGASGGAPPNAAGGGSAAASGANGGGSAAAGGTNGGGTDAGRGAEGRGGARDTSGCGCRAAGERTPGQTGGIAALVASAVLARRRRRGGASALLGAFAAFFVVRGTRAADLNADPTNYKSLIPTLKPGDTLHLAGGTYPRLNVSNLDGTDTTWITIKGPDSGAPAVIEADPGPCCNTVEIRSSSYVALENLTIDGKDVDGAFGVSAQQGIVHHIRVEGCALIHHHGSQQHDGISTKVPTWGWIIRRNTIVGAGTGLYLGNSTGDDPFIGGLIENNLVENPIGYCMEIKWQKPRPSVPGMPTLATTTIIRNNVFIKNDDPSPDGDRPNVLVGGFPDTGPGSDDRYEIYGNLFVHNARESLLQVSGRVTIHDNIFVDAPGQNAILLQNHDLPLKLATVYNNTVYAAATGIHFGSAASQGDAVIGNLLFAGTPVTGTITTQRDNLTDTEAAAPSYVTRPSKTLGQMDFYPLPAKCEGSPLDLGAFTSDTDYAVDFNGTSKGAFTFRGAYAGAGTNPGWPLALGTKTSGPSGSTGGAGNGGAGNGGAGQGGGGAGTAGGTGGASGSGKDAGRIGSPGGGATSPGGASGATSADAGTQASRGATSRDNGGCGCRLAPNRRRGLAGGHMVPLLALIGLVRRRRGLAR